MYQPPTNRILTAESIAYSIEKITGSKGFIDYTPTSTDIYYTKPQIASMQKAVEAIINKKSAGPDNINVHLVPILAPIILKKTLPYLLGLIALGYLLGKL